MNIRYKCFYWTTPKEERTWGSQPTGCKTIRASSEKKAEEIFKHKYPELDFSFASKY